MTLSILHMLRDIQQADIIEELRGADRRDTEYHYTNVYRLLCQPAHGHPVAIANQKAETFLVQACFGFAISTSWLIQACCHVSTTDAKSKIDEALKQIAAILRQKQVGPT